MSWWDSFVEKILGIVFLFIAALYIIVPVGILCAVLYIAIHFAKKYW